MSPVSSLAMKPCEIHTVPGEDQRCCRSGSGSKAQVADRYVARMLALRRGSALMTARASTHCTSRPCDVRNAAPSRVAINSPCASTRARSRSLTSPTSAMPAAICRRRLNCSSSSGLGMTPRSRARSRWRCSICSMTGCHSLPSARLSSCSSRSVMPDRAEWTTTGRRPSASRSRSTAAMFFQFATEETLVPPNFSTTHGEAPGVGSAIVILYPSPREPWRGQAARRPGRPARGLKLIRLRNL